MKFSLYVPRACVALSIGLMTLQTAQADDGGITYRISGYGTAAATVTDQDSLQFRSSLTQSRGAKDTPDLGVDSRLGLQGIVNFTPDINVTAQLLAQRKRKDETFSSNQNINVGVEWLFAQYTPTPGLDVRVGRVVMPAFMISDSRFVGYAQPWLRAPLVMYSLMPSSSLDGAQLLWRKSIGPAVLTVQPGFGRSPYNISYQVPGGPESVIDSTSKNVGSLNTSLEWGNWTVRFGRTTTTSETTLPFVTYDNKDKFNGIGAQYDDGKLLLMFESATRRQGRVPPGGLPLLFPGQFADGFPYLVKINAGYVSAGWRFGKWLPLITVGQLHLIGGIPGGVLLNQPVTDEVYRSLDLSVRYDIASNLALKFQVSSFNTADIGPWVSARKPDERAKVFAAALDFVF